MNRSSLLLAAIAALIGAGITWMVANPRSAAVTAPPATAVDNTALTHANRRIAELEARIESLKNSQPAPAPTLASSDTAAGQQAPTDLQGLMKESRPFLARMTPMFQEMMRNGVEQQIESLTEQLGLTPEQQSALKAKLTAMGEEEMKKFNERLNDPNISPEKLFQRNGGPFNQESLNAALKESLTPEQFSNYEKQQTTERVERLERQATYQVDRLGRKLNLSEEQKDQVFGIMVKSSDPNLQVETESGNGGAVNAGEDQDAAIRAVLTPEQAEIYDQDVKRNNERRQRMRGFFGGGR